MKLKLFLFFSVLISVSGWSSFAQENDKANQISVGIQVRPRAEYRNGYKTPLNKDDKSAGFINQRARLSLEYQREGLSAGLSLQNVSVWGENPISNTNKSNTVVNEAWAQLKSRNGFFMKFGRQVLHYNDGRLLSVADWNQAARSHDALKLGYQTSMHQLDFVLAYNQDAEKNSGGSYYYAYGVPYKTLQTLYYQYNGWKNFNPSFIFINVGLENGQPLKNESKLANIQTMGTNLIYNPLKNLRLHGIGYYQSGKTKNDMNISAYLLSLKAEYDATKQLKLTAGTDLLSGEEYGSPDANDSYNAFNTLYAGNHGFYGVMDLFIDAPYRTGMNVGIWDKYLGTSIKISPRTALGLNYHHFSIASDAYEMMGEKLKKGLGSEIDLQFDYALLKDVKLTCGYSAFLGTKTMDYVKGGDHKKWQDWAFMSINVNPRIFSTKW